jgi:hypothetical protein
MEDGVAPEPACSFLTFHQGVSLTGEVNGSSLVNRLLCGKELSWFFRKGYASETLRVIRPAPEPVLHAANGEGTWDVL